MRMRLFLSGAIVALLSMTASAASYTQDGIIYSVNTSNMRAQVKGAEDTDIKKVDIPKTITYKKKSYTVTSIGEGAFFRCQSASVIIPGSVKSIGDWAFESSAMESLVLNEGITSIGEMAFSECTKLFGLQISHKIAKFVADMASSSAGDAKFSVYLIECQ